jgi:hypothetical protein
VPACQRAGWTLASGFEVEDLGTLSLNPMTAAMLGIAGALSAKRIATDDRIDIQIRTADGLIPPRLLQINGRRISETPGDVAQADGRVPAKLVPAKAGSGDPYPQGHPSCV